MKYQNENTNYYIPKVGYVSFCASSIDIPPGDDMANATLPFESPCIAAKIRLVRSMYVGVPGTLLMERFVRTKINDACVVVERTNYKDRRFHHRCYSHSNQSFRRL